MVSEVSQMNKVSLFGAGFIGGKFAETYPQDVDIVSRESTYPTCPDVLYMISTVNNYHAKEGRPLLDIQTNLITFMETLDGLRLVWGTNATFNLVSTWFVYGKTKVPAKEDSACNPTGFYSITARAREQLLISYCETFGMKYRILRLGNVIGVGDKKISNQKNALQFMVRELAQGRQIDLYESDTVRDYIDVRDVVSAIRLVLEKGKTNEIYNIANGQGKSVGDLVQHAHAAANYTGKINMIPAPEFHRLVQVNAMYMDNSKIKKLGYVQQYDIKQSVASLAEYYKANE